MKKHLLTLAFLALFMATASSAANAVNLIVNGDFETGVIDPSITQYTLYTPGPNGLGPEGVYGIVKDPSLSHPNFVSMGDHTTGSGYMMAVNAVHQSSLPIPYEKVWEQTVNVEKFSIYEFSAWLANMVSPCIAPQVATLDFRINGISLGTQEVDYKAGKWENFKTFWDSKGDTLAHVSIYDISPYESDKGNDFALDDISLEFTTGAVTPEPSSMLLGLMGAAGLLGTRKRNKIA